jgi:hypothetical protein
MIVEFDCRLLRRNLVLQVKSSVVVAAQSAQDALQQALGILQSVTTHNPSPLHTLAFLLPMSKSLVQQNPARRFAARSCDPENCQLY